MSFYGIMARFIIKKLQNHLVAIVSALVMWEMFTKNFDKGFLQLIDTLV